MKRTYAQLLGDLSAESARLDYIIEKYCRRAGVEEYTRADLDEQITRKRANEARSQAA